MRIDSSGNVGIGETSPLGKLHVKSADSGAGADAGADELVVEGSGDSGLSILSGASNNGTILFSDSGDSAAGGLRYEQSNNALNFRTNGAWDRLYINSSGKCGIGTSSPQEMLTVNSGTTGSSFIQVTNTTLGTGDNAGLYVGVQSDEDGYIGMRSNQPLAFATNNTERMRIDTSGNLLVNTTNTDPTANRVDGINISSSAAIFSRSGAAWDLGKNSTSGVHISFYTDNGSARVGAGNISSNGSTTAYNTSSDGRLKDVTGSARGLEVINELNPVSYNWKADGKADEGLIAQEVLDIVPNAVSGSEEDMYQMDYSKLVVHLVKAVKELSTEVDELKKQLEK